MWASNTQIELESTNKWNISGAMLALQNEQVLLGSLLIDLVSYTTGDPGFMSSGEHDHGIM